MKAILGLRCQQIKSSPYELRLFWRYSELDQRAVRESDAQKTAMRIFMRNKMLLSV